MQRLRLPLCLAFLILILGGLGVYREAGIRLSHALDRFRAALPAGANFHYTKVRPAFLLGGVTLYDVSFHYKDTDFHARRVRFGYPKLLSSGTLRLASLLLDSPSYTDHTHQITATEASFHHLHIPSSAETLHEGHGEADSMRSLAAIMSFEPEDVTALRFEHMQLTHLHVTQVDNPSSAAPIVENVASSRPFTIRTLSAESLVVEGYGQGLRVHTLVNGLSMSVSLPSGKESIVPPVLRQILLPNNTGAPVQMDAPMEMNLALQHLEAREGYIQWLKRPFQHSGNPSEAFWQDPAATLWEKPGKLEIDGLSLLFNQHDLRRTLILNHLAGERRAGENNDLRTEGELRGLTTRLSPPPSLQAAPISLPTDYHIVSTSQKKMSEWQETLQLRTLFGKDSPSLMTVEFNLPDINPLHLGDNSVSRFLQAGQCLGTELTVQGLDIFAYYGILTHQSDTPTDSGKPAEKPEAAKPVLDAPKGSMMAEQGYMVTPRFNALALQKPILAPVLDFLLAPERRTITFKTGPLSLEELSRISSDSNDTARFDRLHVIGVTTQDQ